MPNGKVHLPKIGFVRYANSREFPSGCEIIKLTIKKNKINEYFVDFALSICVENKLINLDVNKSLGFDYSSTHFIIDNNGKSYDIPDSIKELDKTIAREYKQLRKMHKGSNRYKKLRIKIQPIYNRVVDNY